DHRDAQSRTLPEVLMVHFRHRRLDAMADALLQGTHDGALVLERRSSGKMKLDSHDSDEHREAQEAGASPVWLPASGLPKQPRTSREGSHERDVSARILRSEERPSNAVIRFFSSPLEGASQLFDGERLDGIAHLDIVHAIETDSALEAVRHLTDV